MWRDQGGQAARAVVGVTLAALLAILVLVARGPLGQLLARLDAGTNMVVYLSPYVSEDRGHALAAALGRREGVVASAFVDRAATKQRLADVFRGNEALLDELDASALPASIELRFAPGVADVMPVSPLPAELRALPEVAELTFIGRDDHALAAMLEASRRAVVYGGWFLLAVAFGVGVFALRAGTVDIRREATVIELLGGPRRMWRVPAVLVGGLQGGLGVGFGIVAGYWLFRAAAASMITAYPAMLEVVDLSYVPATTCVALAACGVGMGMAVAACAVGARVANRDAITEVEPGMGAKAAAATSIEDDGTWQRAVPHYRTDHWV